MSVGDPGDDSRDGVPGEDGRDGSPGAKGRQLIWQRPSLKIDSVNGSCLYNSMH